MKLKKYRRIIIFVIFFSVTIFLVYEALVSQAPGLWKALTSGNEGEVEKFLSESGKWSGLVALGLLQFVQVVSIVLPGLPIQIAGGMVYGALRGYIVCHFMYVFANVVIMTMVRKFSGLSDLIGSGNQSKIQKALDFINKGNPLVTVAILCMLPVVPNGIIPYAASQMDIRIKDFALSVFLGSFYPVLSVVLMGRFLVTGNYFISGLLMTVNILLVVILYFNRGRLSSLVDTLKQRKNKTGK